MFILTLIHLAGDFQMLVVISLYQIWQDGSMLSPGILSFNKQSRTPS